MLHRFSNFFRNVMAKWFGRGTEKAGGSENRFSLGPSVAGSGGKPKAMIEWEAASKQTLDWNASPEELCGLRPDMTPDQIRDHLAILYRRHNRAAASLDLALRDEAETMLNAIVQCREKLATGKPDPVRSGPAHRSPV
jgi:hypothetical protein